MLQVCSCHCCQCGNGNCSGGRSADLELIEQPGEVEASRRLNRRWRCWSGERKKKALLCLYVGVKEFRGEQSQD